MVLECEETPLLSQEGWPEGPGWFQRNDSSVFGKWNHPPRDPLRDPAALLTQEGKVLLTKLIAAVRTTL
jgi:hypothetical protein